MPSSRANKNVYFKDDCVLHTILFQKEEDFTSVGSVQNRTRFAYIVISKKEVKEEIKDKKNSDILELLEEKYNTILEKAIKEEESVTDVFNIKSSTKQYINNKLILTNTAKVFNTKKGIDSILKVKNYFCERKILDTNSNKEEKSIGSLEFKYDKVSKVLEEESLYYNKKKKSFEDEPYAIISLPYGYNYDKENKKAKLFYDLNHTLVSLVPIVKIEYGIFFDGTNNNMYNIDFYRKHKELLNRKVEFIKGTIDSEDIDSILSANEGTWEHYILTEDNPKKTPRIMNLLRNEIITEVRYFEASSTKEFLNLYNEDEDKASEHSNYIFDFLLEIKNTLMGKGDTYLRNLREQFISYSDSTGEKEDIKKFIIKNLLPSGKTSSYTNGYTNIKRLYDLYEAKDFLNPKENKYSLRRFKSYASGSGTVDPIDLNYLSDDSIFGLGLGTLNTGVEAHIIYACEKIAQNLRENNLFHVHELIIDTFGFSRGATSARHFVCSILKNYELLKDKDKHQKYALNTEETDKTIFDSFYDKGGGIYTEIGNKRYFNPLRTKNEFISNPGKSHIKNPYFKKKNIQIDSISFRHVGIGDTVTHFGISQKNDYKDLNIEFDEKKVGKVYHLMAGDEYRHNFNAYSIFGNYTKDIQETGNFKELTIPGAHADVGGGYDASDKNITQCLSTKSYIEYHNTFKTRFINWNNKYQWIKGITNLDKTNVNFNDKESSFYSKKHGNRNSLVSTYMNRINISWEYELVCLKLFYDEALNKEKDEKERTPLKKNITFDDLVNQYASDLNDIDKKFLKDVLSELKTNKPLSTKKLHELRQRFMHHSSDDSFIDGAKKYQHSLGLDEIYGKRVIYGVTGDEYKG